MKLTLQSLAERIDILEKSVNKEPEIILSPVSNIDELCDKIAESIRKKDGWVSTEYTLDKLPLRIWVSNEDYVEIYAPEKIELSPRNKKVLWKAYCDFQENPPVSLLYKLFKFL